MSLIAALAGLKKTASSLADDYGRRLDAHLAGLPDDAARAAMLGREFNNWTERYENWATAVDLGQIKVTPDGPTAYDFTETLAVIGQRRGKYQVAA